MNTRTISSAFFVGIFIATMSLMTVYAHAEERDQNDRAQSDDKVSAQDRDFYRRADIENRFGVHFHSHRDVCTNAAQDEVHCNARVVTDDAGMPLVATPQALPAGFAPQQLTKAYGLTGNATTSRRIIAIVDAYDDPNIQSDLNTFSTTYGLPKLPACTGAITASNVPCFKKVNQSGNASPLPQRDSGWSLEIALDVETAHAMCQNCSILLVEANSASFASLMAAVDRAVLLGAKVVSNSYGAPEFSGETTYDTHFNKPGVAFTVSSGDSGYGVEYPAASRYVTAVGGTSLFLNADGSYNSEIAWAGAGSGCSAYEVKQPWQTDPLCSKRMVADVSAAADPNTGVAVYDTVRFQGQSGWFQVGGTSLASPVIAAIYAISGNTSGSANSLPYSLANVSTLNDVASGTNGSCGGTYFCTGLTGFDGPTGLGSPRGFGAF